MDMPARILAQISGCSSVRAVSVVFTGAAALVSPPASGVPRAAGTAAGVFNPGSWVASALAEVGAVGALPVTTFGSFVAVAGGIPLAQPVAQIAGKRARGRTTDRRYFFLLA
jgi:hypothetical protein